MLILPVALSASTGNGTDAMHMQVVTIFPEMVGNIAEFGVVGRAVDRGLLSLDCLNPRDFTEDKHRTVDDRPYGGGPGMVMKYAPLEAALSAAKAGATQVFQAGNGLPTTMVTAKRRRYPLPTPWAPMPSCSHITS